MAWFTGRATKEKLSSIKTLVAVMLVDGRLDDNERVSNTGSGTKRCSESDHSCSVADDANLYTS